MTMAGDGLRPTMAEPRPDGRQAAMLRPMRCERGVLRRADGSARYSHDRTTVLVAVYGPCEVKKRREELERATLELIVRPPSGPPRAREREMESLLHGLFAPLVVTTLHPRAAVCIIVQVVEDDGAVLAAAINCAAVALMDAGVAMRSIPSAVALALGAGDTGGADAALLDPCRAEEAAAAGMVTVACAHTLSASRKDGPAVALLSCSGRLDPDELDALVRLAQGSHDLICEFAKRALAQGMAV
ncbi:ribosomal protein S5 domain 2-type protein [Pavlovales sp. CCMP2436]|nr:ribosomal protein S5 domain 2-type protein [Pavlovales sp. CCMP2436]